MDDVKTQLASRIKEASNVLVTVTSNPSVDQLAAAIGLTLMLNKLSKHATAVFSGAVPSTINFLSPEKTIEKTTDSLRDFIISLDKSKADKLRYKIEDNFVKIFITPYHASIGEKDLVFSQGDFNVDVVVALGVHQREELDQAITSHGRILHDATVTTINTQPPSNLGSINWSDNKSSSLCEMLVVLSDLLGSSNIFDAQIANALLTGIVAETQRFSNQKTTSVTMSSSSKLLSAGANQQLVAKELAPKPEPVPVPKPSPPEEAPVSKTEQPSPLQPVTPKPAAKKPNDGELRIDHGNFPKEEDASDVTQVIIDDQGTLSTIDPNAKSNEQQEPPKTDEPQSFLPKPDESNTDVQGGAKFVTDRPPLSGELNANDTGKEEDNYVDPLTSGDTTTNTTQPPLLNHEPVEATQVNNPSGLPNLNEVRNAVDAALANNPNPVSNQPLQALNAQPLGLDLNNNLSSKTENGDSHDTPPAIIPNTSLPLPDTPPAPPVPPPIVVPPDLSDDSLPPSMTAL